MLLRKRCLPLILLLTAALSGCYASRNLFGGMKSMRLVVVPEQLEELTLILAEGKEALECDSYEQAVALVEADRIRDWLNFFQLIPPDGEGVTWSVGGRNSKRRYVRLDEEAIEATEGTLDIPLQFERWNLEVDDEEATFLVIAWFEGRRVESWKRGASDLRELEGTLRVSPTGIEFEEEAE